MTNRAKIRRAGLTAFAALALAAPAGVGAAPPAERMSSDQAVAVLTCVEYRRIIGHDAFGEAFRNIRGCVAMVVPSSD